MKPGLQNAENHHLGGLFLILCLSYFQASFAENSKSFSYLDSDIKNCEKKTNYNWFLIRNKRLNIRRFQCNLIQEFGNSGLWCS